MMKTFSQTARAGRVAALTMLQNRKSNMFRDDYNHKRKGRLVMPFPPGS